MHIEQPGSRHSPPAARTISSSPSASAWRYTSAEPGTTNFVPRPDWYFYFLFYLLRIFEWPETVFIATVGIPTILLILLIGLPFYDRRRERRPSRRPVAMVAAEMPEITRPANSHQRFGASAIST